MNARNVQLAVAALCLLSACHIAGRPDILDGTVCDEDVRDEIAEWWVKAPPLSAMDKVTKALKLRIDLSERATDLRAGIEARDDECRKVYYREYGPMHERIDRLGTEMERFKDAQREVKGYDPDMASRSYQTYCAIAAEIQQFITKVEECRAAAAR